MLLSWRNIIKDKMRSNFNIWGSCIITKLNLENFVYKREIYRQKKTSYREYLMAFSDSCGNQYDFQSPHYILSRQNKQTNYKKYWLSIWLMFIVIIMVVSVSSSSLFLVILPKFLIALFPF